MKKQIRSLLYTATVGAGLLGLGYAAVTTPKALAQAFRQVANKTKVVAGQQYTFTKYVDSQGNIRSEVRNSNGRVINENAVPQGRPPLVEARVLALMKQQANANSTIKVNVALNLPEVVTSQETPETGGAQVSNGSIESAFINGRAISKNALAQHSNAHANQQRAQQVQRANVRAQQLGQWAGRHSLGNKEGIQEAMRQGRAGVTLNLTVQELQSLIRSGDKTIDGIELYEPGKDTINEAMAATSISTSALPNSNTRGNGIGIYMTENGCANDSRITNYRRLSGSETDHSRNVGAIMRAVSPGSFIYCRGGAVLPQSSDLGGVGGNPPIHIINRSNNSTDDSTSYSTLDRDWDDFVYQNNIATFLSAANQGTGTGNVLSPAKGLNIITVGNYNDANNTISSSSSFVDPNTKNNKPELSGPGTNITAGGFTMSGTSMASPHAAAFLADMMSDNTVLKYRPYLAKANMLSGATDAISGGYDKVGLGGIDFASAHWDGYWQWYSGNNSSFSYFDQQDGKSDGYVEKRVYISSSWSRARVALSWLTRGTYTYSHRADAHPIGMDLDLQVYGPNGNLVGGSYSWDNPFESLNFTPTTSGYYTFKISRPFNRDTSLDLRMGLDVNYYNP